MSSSETSPRTSDATVFVVDTDAEVHQRLRPVFESVGLKVQTFPSAGDFLEEYHDDVPGCVLCEAQLGTMSGLELQEQLRARLVDVPLIVHTAPADVSLAVRALKGGAFDFLEKPCSEQVLVEQVRRAVAQDVVRCERRRERRRALACVDRLSWREREVLSLLAGGLSTRQIALKLGITPKTAEAHRANIFRKAGTSNLPKLVCTWLFATGEFTPPPWRMLPASPPAGTIEEQPEG